MKYLRLFSFASILLFALSQLGCNQATNNQQKEKSVAKPIVTVEAESALDASSELIIEKKEKETYITLKQEGWIAFDVNFPEAGRYKVEIKAKGISDTTARIWVEDYIDNKDGRTYNVTSNIEVPANMDSFETYWKDGSPFNKGLHKMKLHSNQAVDIDFISFTMIRKRVETPITKTQNMKGDEWVIAWADEFDGAEIDADKWTYDLGNWGWGNFELQYYTENRKKNARIEHGNLIIEAHKNDMNQPWTSARLTTRGKVSFLYGKIEFRAMVPAEKGNWAAGWTLGDDYIDELSWPYCGEIDILESVGYEMDDETGNGIAHASAHSGAYYFKLGNQPTSTTEVKNMNNEYHTYAVEWSPEKIDILVDDSLYFTYDDTSTELSWPFAKPHNIILNLAMGGGWGGAQGMNPDVTTQKMMIDYVRVYERK